MHTHAHVHTHTHTHTRILSRFSPVRLCVTLWTVAHQAPLSMRFSRQYGSGFPCPPGDLPNPGTAPKSLMSPALAGGFFTTSATWEALHIGAHTHTHKYLLCSNTYQTLSKDWENELCSEKETYVAHLPPPEGQSHVISYTLKSRYLADI